MQNTRSKTSLRNLCFVLGLVFFIPTIAFGEVIQSNEGTSIDTENFGTSGGGKGQSFENPTDYDITSIEIWGGLGNSAGTEATLTIYEGEGMAGSAICTETIDVTGWPNWSSADWQEMTITCNDIIGGDRYTFELEAVDGSSNDALRWATSDTSYADGQEYFNSSGRSSRDTMFRINGTEIGEEGTSTATTSTSTIESINNLNITLLTAFGFIMLLLGLLIPLWIFKYIRP